VKLAVEERENAALRAYVDEQTLDVTSSAPAIVDRARAGL
jgi:hypothetical protein